MGYAQRSNLCVIVLTLHDLSILIMKYSNKRSCNWTVGPLVVKVGNCTTPRYKSCIDCTFPMTFPTTLMQKKTSNSLVLLLLLHT